MKLDSQYKLCKTCKSIIPLEKAIIKKSPMNIKMPYGTEKIPMVSYTCPSCNSWLFSTYDDNADARIFSNHGDTIEQQTKERSNTLVESIPEVQPSPIIPGEDMTDKIKQHAKKKGTVIVIEGTDGSGKRTQSELLLNKLNEMGIKASLYSFPNYESGQGQLVKRYLNGEFKGQPIQEFNTELTRNALLYTTDRLVTCMEKGPDGRSILEKYNDGEVIIFDRYTQSNFIHQGCNIDDQDQLEGFIEYFTNLEYGLLGLPRPDVVIYLKVTPEMCMKNIEKRGNEKDIHENIESLRKANKHVEFLIDWLGWESVHCVEGLANLITGEQSERMRSIDEIQNDVFKIVEKVLHENNQTRHVPYCPSCLKHDIYGLLTSLHIGNNTELSISQCNICGEYFDTKKL